MRIVQMLSPLLATFVLLAGPLHIASANEIHTVTAQATSFDPDVVVIAPGDTVQFENMTGHNAVTRDGLIPDGADAFEIPMGQNGSVTLDVEGVYIYECEPHFAMGQVGAIVVGDPVNLDQVDERASGMEQRAVASVKQAVGK